MYDRHFFNRQKDGSLRSARVILSELFTIHKPQSVIDVGCGVGSWLAAAIDLGAERVVGVDGSYIDHEQLMLENSSFICCDLSKENLPLAIDTAFDLTISMEVAEHLPDSRAELFVLELCRLSDIILF